MNWTRRSFLSAVPSATLLTRNLQAAPSAPQVRPNVVVIAAEDVGAWMLASYGNLEIATPNLDRLAASGARFLDNFACTPAGSASRATLLSGRLPRQHGILDEVTPAPQPNPARGQAAAPASFQSEILLSDVLASAGYHCAFAGAWGLGQDEHPGHGFADTATLTTDGACVVNGQRTPINTSVFEGLTHHALEFLDKQQASNPFLLVVSFPALESVFAALPARCADQYKGANFTTFGIQPAAAGALEGRDRLTNPVASLRKVAAALTLLDEQVGALEKKIIQRGVLENTVVVFTGLHGELLGRHGLWGAGYGSNPPNFYDETIRTPLLVSWPGRIPTQSVRPEMVSVVDLVPTLCDLTGAAAPRRNLSGRSFLALALNRPLPKRQIWHDLVFGELRDIGMARDNRFMLVLRGDDQAASELFDLRKDPGELVNEFENPGFLEVRARLTEALRVWHEKYAS
jgi:arylsulfatase A-like enzyme